MSDLADFQKIAHWLESLHCTNVQCLKGNCLLFRKLASEVRQGAYDE